MRGALQDALVALERPASVAAAEQVMQLHHCSFASQQNKAYRPTAKPTTLCLTS